MSLRPEKVTVSAEHPCPATLADQPELACLVDAAIRVNLAAFLTPDQVHASHAIMGLDTQLIRDGTYFVIRRDGVIAACGGWSRRATLYGGDTTPGRDAALLDPARDAARVRAMYTHPAYTRRGLGRLVLAACEAAACAAGFGSVELMATMGGEPLYRACGYRAVEPVSDDRGGVPVPLLRMVKSLV